MTKVCTGRRPPGDQTPTVPIRAPYRRHPETVDLGWAGKESGRSDASDGLAVARRGLQRVGGRVVLPDRDHNAVAATASEQVPFEPLMGAEHRQRLLRGEALVLCGSCLIYLGPPDPHDHCPTM